MKLLPLLVASLLSGAAGATFAQDATVLPPAWLNDANVAGEAPPTFRRRSPDVVYPRDLRDSAELGYVLVVQTVAADGKRLVLMRGATHPYFGRAVFEALGEFDCRPARRDGEPVDSLSWFAVLFNPAASETRPADAQPRLLAVAPVWVTKADLAGGKPDDLPAVWGTVALDASGTPGAVTFEPPVTASVRAAVEASLPAWRFAPARRGGQAVAAEVRVPFLLQPPPPADVLARMTPPKVLRRTQPHYPAALRRNRLRGEVEVRFEVGTDGRVHDAVVQRSNHPAFDEPALEAVRQWTFEPARRNGELVKAKQSVTIVFSMSDERGGGQEPVQVRAPRDQSKLPEALQVDSPPKPRGFVRPVYPYELLRSETKGRCVLAVLVGPNGRVTSSRVLEATAPEFGFALAAMAERLEFDPALKDGQPTSALLKLEQEFSRSPQEQLVSSDDTALLRLEERAPEKIVAANTLDAPPRPVSRRAPVFPVALRDSHPTGRAVVEFLIDDDGRARLPRVREATAAEFGYAAVQAVAAWEFEPPTAGGKRVVTRVAVPFEFNPAN